MGHDRGLAMKKFIFSLFCLFFIVFSTVSHAVTIQTQLVNGSYVAMTGPLTNPSVGALVPLVGAAVTRANPWLYAINNALQLYKLYNDISPTETVSVRPLSVSEHVPTWTNNTPPVSAPQLAALDRVGDYGFTSTPYFYYGVSLRSAKTSYCLATSYISYDEVNNWCVNSLGGHSGYVNFTYSANVKYCNSGYSYINQACTLSDASKVPYPSDNVPTFTVNNQGKFTKDLRDPDSSLPSVQSIEGESSITSISPDGKQTSTISANPDGSINYQTTNQYIDSSDSSVRNYTQNMTLNSYGNVINYSSTNPEVQVVNGVVQPVQNSTNTVVFPSDYARVGEAQAAANSVNSKLDSLHDDLTNPGTPANDPIVPGDDKYTDFSDTFQNLTSWQFPSHLSECPTASFVSPWATSYTFDAHCQLITDNWAVLQAAMTVVWTLAALFIVLKA